MEFKLLKEKDETVYFYLEENDGQVYLMCRKSQDNFYLILYISRDGELRRCHQSSKNLEALGLSLDENMNLIKIGN